MTDAEPLASCIDRAYAPFKARISDLPDVSAGVLDDIKYNTVLVALSGDRVVGGAILVLDGEVSHLTNIAVDPRYSGRGIGRMLIARIEQEAHARGFAKIRLSTHVAMPKNVSLYRRLGWSVDETAGNTVKMSKDIRDL
ncbi:MAG: GNAT family N-acetyltransferase [Roseibium sp.]|nr:GNAT family N-acetyltransferase [Roseibium sp.]